jgi:uncharacterized protein (DUF1697 family)
MSSYISILRGINVSGQKKILMADLKSLYEELGFSNIQTYIQSGNVVFEYQETKAEELQELIFKKIQSHYGFDVPNLILSPSNIQEALTKNPYQEIEKMYFVFLAKTPTQENIDVLSSFNFDNEFYEIKDKVIYTHFQMGMINQNSEIVFEIKLNFPSTTRNLKKAKKILYITV